MPRNICPIYRIDTLDNAWIDIREVYGPTPIIGSNRYTEDMTQWMNWSSSKGVNSSDANLFGKWLIWLLMYGTVDYGNLPSNKRNEHEGRCWSPCPFDLARYNENRAKAMLGYIPTNLTDHGNFYMKPVYHGVWGMECTYLGCSFLIERGHPYFYV
jgi:hypothetical protein